LATLNWLLNATLAKLLLAMNISKVALGLGFVIFLHELGHFLLAKWNGVKVEKFSIGFGPTLFGFTRGETEYVLAAIPLGGFVKMLGEGVEGEATKSSDPSAYPNKSVSARMAIISAGVIMNLILGFVCFAYAYGQGMEVVPTRIGTVSAGSPAYLAGLRRGDEIVGIDGRTDLNFNVLLLKVRLSGTGQRIKFDVKRPGVEKPLTFELEPLREAMAKAPTIGVSPMLGLKLPDPPFVVPAGYSGLKDTPWKTLRPNDQLRELSFVREGATQTVPLDDTLQLFKLLGQNWDIPIDFHLEHAKKPGEPGGPTTEVMTLPPNHFVDFGFRLTLEPISAIRGGSPAAAAGFRKGDRIVKVNGQDFDPMRLPTLCYESAGKPMTFEVVRDEAGVSSVVSLTATPDDSVPWTEWQIGGPLDIAGLGLAYPVRTRITAVTPGSPADKAGLKPGNVINAMTLAPLDMNDRVEKAEEIKFDDKSARWPLAFQRLQERPLQPVAFRVDNGDKPVTITPEIDETWFHPLRGLLFNYLSRMTPPLNLAQATERGFHDTIDNILSIYATIRSLFEGRVAPDQLGGPIRIAGFAFAQASEGLTELVHFLGILSINLAVLNFLPIPPLDGGQMVFLCAEKVRGRPLPDSAVSFGSILGVAMVLCLMVYVLYQDVMWVFS
jgi:regulator of sigma E protease